MVAQVSVAVAATCALVAVATWSAAARRRAVFPTGPATAVALAALLAAAAATGLLLAEGRSWSAAAVGALLLLSSVAGGVAGVGVVRALLPDGGAPAALAEGMLVGSGLVTVVWAALSAPGPATLPRLAAASAAAVLAGLLVTMLRVSVTARGLAVDDSHRGRVLVGVTGLGLLLAAALLAALPRSVPLTPATLLVAGAFALVAIVPAVPDAEPVLRRLPTGGALLVPATVLGLAVAAVGAQVALGRAGAVTGALVAVVGGSLVAVQTCAVQARVELLTDLEISRQRLEALVENTQDAVLGLDVSGRVVAANPAVERLLGCPPEQLVGHDVAEIAVLDDRPAVREAVRDVVHRRRAGATLGLRLVAPAGGAAELRLREVDGGAVAVLTDLTEAGLLRERLQLLARHDRMTGLVNRGVVLDTVTGWLAVGGPVSLLYCDLDGYKAVNDRFGHLAGDAVIVEVARRLETAVRGIRAEEAVLGRIGGDEFVVALRGVHGREAVAAGERLVAAMRPTFVVGDRTVRLGISVGVSGTDDAQPLPALPAGRAVDQAPGLFPAELSAAELSTAELSAAELLHRGDLAMFEAKSAGRAKVARWDPAVSQRALRRVDIAIGLRQALDTGRLALVYQPLVRLSDGVVVGVEALIRVEAAGDEPGALSGMAGVVSPGELVEVAEDTGEITELGHWVLRQATQRAALWRALGHDLFVTVNMSVRQLADDGFVASVRRALADCSLEPGRLVVEITEGQLVGEEDPVRDVIEELRRDGVQFVIDDFGTGYSSLSYLRSMPVRAIKLDRTLLDGIGTDHRATILVRSVIGVARALGLVVVAEGLETLEAARLVRDLGAWAGQGFALHPPMRESELLDVLRAPIDLSGAPIARPEPTRVVDITDPVVAALVAAAAGTRPEAAGSDLAPDPAVDPVFDPAADPAVDPAAAAAPGEPGGPDTGGLVLDGRRFGAHGPVGEAPLVAGGTGGVAGVVLPSRGVSDGKTATPAD